MRRSMPSGRGMKMLERLLEFLGLNAEGHDKDRLWFFRAEQGPHLEMHPRRGQVVRCKADNAGLRLAKFSNQFTHPQGAHFEIGRQGEVHLRQHLFQEITRVFRELLSLHPGPANEDIHGRILSRTPERSDSTGLWITGLRIRGPAEYS